MRATAASFRSWMRTRPLQSRNPGALQRTPPPPHPFPAPKNSQLKAEAPEFSESVQTLQELRPMDFKPESRSMMRVGPRGEMLPELLESPRQQSLPARGVPML